MSIPSTTIDDLRITNFYPDADAVLIEVRGFKITVYRDERFPEDEAYIDIEDTEEGSRYSTILGKEGETHRL
jgi:hypothetical protein